MISNIGINIDFNAFISYLISDEMQETLFPLKLAFLIAAFILAGTIIFNLSRSHYLQWLFIHDLAQFITMRPFGAKKITKQWNKILRRLETGLESEYKLAVIEADDMIDVSLKRMGYDGQTVEEKLGKLTSAALPNIQQIYEIHHLRNNIVHDPDYRLILGDARRALDVYAQAFTHLQILGE